MQRVSQSMIAKLFLRDLHGGLNRLLDAQKRMSSQQRYSKPSDNPSEVSRGMSVKGTLSLNGQHRRNLDDALTWLSNTDQALGQIGDILTTIREKTVYAGNGSLSDIGRNAIAQDIRALREELVQTAGFNVEGRTLLSGTETSTPPFVIGSDGKVFYQGNLSAVVFEVDKGQTCPVSLNGRDVFPVDFVQRQARSIEIPLDFSWKGASQQLEIRTGTKTVLVPLPLRWNDRDDDSALGSSDFDGFLSPGESVSGYSLSEIAELINQDEAARQIVRASVETDSAAGVQRLCILSLSGESVQLTSLPWEETLSRGEYLKSETVGIGWTAGQSGEIAIQLHDGSVQTVSLKAGDSLESVSKALASTPGLRAGVREDGSLSIIREDGQPFSLTATGSALPLFPGGAAASSPLLEPSSAGQEGLTTALGLDTAVRSDAVSFGASLGNTIEKPLDMVLLSGNHRIELSVADDADLTLAELADRIRASAGDWIDVILKESPEKNSLADSSSLDAEGGVQRLILRARDGESLTVYDMQNDWARTLGLNNAAVSGDLSGMAFPGAASPETPARIAVQVGNDRFLVKISPSGVVRPDGTLDPAELARRIREQVGEDRIRTDIVQSGGAFALYSPSGEPIRLTDLDFADPSLAGRTSGLAMAVGLASGITGDWVSGGATAPEGGCLAVSSGGRSLTVSVSPTETLSDLANKLRDQAGSWLDVSLADDGSGRLRLALSARDGSPLSVSDRVGTAAETFGIGTDLRLQAGTWTGGGTLTLESGGESRTFDLRDVDSLEGIASLVNARIPGGEIRASVSGTGPDRQLVLESFNGYRLKAVPPSEISPVPVFSPLRSSAGGNSAQNQNLTARSGMDLQDGDLFSLLEDLAAAVEQGAAASLSEDFLPRLDQAFDDLLGARSFCGALQRRVETASARLQENGIAYTELYSKIMDTDMAEATMEFQVAQATYQATLATIARVIQPTLVDYLR
ncbi:MAG: flagellar hook-associated protein FlgL [Synergistales bacterium]